ncbi:MAG: opioid growth factor receptor-related protein [Bdellovibrionia bacterium]
MKKTQTLDFLKSQTWGLLLALLIPSSGWALEESSLIAFYRGNGSDHHGQKIEELWAMDDFETETHHDFIQWLFPTRYKNRVNPLAPSLQPSDLETFKEDIGLRERVLHSLDFMLHFYGLKRESHGALVEIHKTAQFDLQATDWLKRGNHNYERILRILISLSTLGLKAEARALYQVLAEEIYPSHAPQVGSSTLRYWKWASEGLLDEKDGTKNRPQFFSQN